MDAVKNRNLGLCWPTESHIVKFKRMSNKLYYAVFRLLLQPLKLLLSQLRKFCQNSLS